MDEESGSKLTGIRQIVRLKGFLQKWKSVTIGNSSKTRNNRQQKTNYNKPHRRRRSSSGVSPDIIKRLRVSNNQYCDSDEESSCHGPADVPKGYLAVYVGEELRRFIIPTRYLSHSLFKVLLEKVEEEFGFDHNGGLTIPCEIETFKFLLNCMEHHPKDDYHAHSSAAEAILSH